MNTDFLWVEEYRPKTIDDCILPTSLKTSLTSGTVIALFCSMDLLLIILTSLIKV